MERDNTIHPVASATIETRAAMIQPHLARRHILSRPDRALMVFELIMQQQRRGGFSPPASVTGAIGRGKPASTLLLQLIFNGHKRTAKFIAPLRGKEVTA